MECVIDSSSLSWLEQTRHLDLLLRVYERIIASPGVLRQLESHYPTREFIEEHVTPLRLKERKTVRRLQRLSRRWQRKTGIQDIVDAEVFVAYRYFTEANEALYANKGAEEIFSHYGTIRDIAKLYELAESQGIFSRDDSIAYLHSFLAFRRPYREPYVRALLHSLGGL